jgi:hypothetical protein
MPETPTRTIRADDDTWDKAKALARAATPTGVSVSQWIRDTIHAHFRDKRNQTKDGGEHA